MGVRAWVRVESHLYSDYDYTHLLFVACLPGNSGTLQNKRNCLKVDGGFHYMHNSYRVLTDCRFQNDPRAHLQVVLLIHG